MPQNVETTQQTSAGKSIGNIIAALKSSFGSGSGDNGMFASLLAETGSSQPQVKVREAAVDSVKTEPLRTEQDIRKPERRDDKEDVRANEDREDGPREAEGRKEDKEAAAAKEVDGAKKEVAQTGQGLEHQLAKALKSTEDIDAAEDINQVLADVAAEADNTEPYEKVADFLSSLFPNKDEKGVEDLVKEMLVSMEGEGGEEAADPLNALAAASQVLEGQLGRSKAFDQAMSKVQADGENLGEKIASDVKGALSQLADKMALLKEARDAIGQEGLGLGKGEAASEDGAKGSESLWQKMVQDLKLESMGLKKAAPDMQAMQTMEGDKAAALKAAQAPVVGQMATAAVQATKVSGDAPTPAAPAVAPTAAQPVGVSTEGGRPVGSYDFASQLSEARETKGGTAGLPKAIEQVAVQLHKAVKEGKTEMTVNLRPAELGKVEIKLTFGEGKSVTGLVMAENQASLTLLQKDADGLVRALQEAGLDADMNTMEFSLKDEGNSSSHAQNQNDAKSKKAMNVAVPMEEGDADLSDLGSDVYYLEPGRVNLQVQWCVG